MKGDFERVEWKTEEKKTDEETERKIADTSGLLGLTLYDVLRAAAFHGAKLCGGNETPWDLKEWKFMNELMATRAQYGCSSMGADAEVYLEFRLRS